MKSYPICTNKTVLFANKRYVTIDTRDCSLQYFSYIINYPVFLKKKNNKNSLKINGTHFFYVMGQRTSQCNKSKQVNLPGLNGRKKRRKKLADQTAVLN